MNELFEGIGAILINELDWWISASNISTKENLNKSDY